MQIAEQVDLPTGVLAYDVFRRGVLIERCRDRNLIVNGAKGMLASLLGGAVTGKSVNRIGFGTNGTAPASANTALTGAFLKPVGAPTYTANSVSFPFTLDAGDANGLAIIEFGLLAADGTLFSRRVRGSVINKAADISFIGSWTIAF